MTVLEVLEQAKALSVAERKELTKLLIDSLDTAPPTRTHSILEFEGMAAQLADEEDVQEYLQRIRSEWDDRP